LHFAKALHPLAHILKLIVQLIYLLIEEIFSSLSEQTSAYFMKRELGVHFYEYEQVKKSLKYQGIQTRMDFQLTIE
jgi:hypothetical protein